MTIEEEIAKESARVERLKRERDKGYAIRVAQLLREAMTIAETMESQPSLRAAVASMCEAADQFSAWEPVPTVPS